jgi:hypothetical protein
MNEPSMTDLLALIDGAIAGCEDSRRLENFCNALHRLGDQAARRSQDLKAAGK